MNPREVFAHIGQVGIISKLFALAPALLSERRCASRGCAGFSDFVIEEITVRSEPRQLARRACRPGHIASFSKYSFPLQYADHLQLDFGKLFFKHLGSGDGLDLKLIKPG